MYLPLFISCQFVSKFISLKSGVDRSQEDNVRSTAFDLVDNAGVELLTVGVTHVVLESALILVGLLDNNGAIVTVVDLETDVTRLLSDVSSHLRDSVSDKLFLTL